MIKEEHIKANVEYIKDAMNKGWTFEEAVENRKRELMKELSDMIGVNSVLGELK